MRDPVVASDGHSYEREAIMAVLQSERKLSPLTREQLETQVFANVALRKRIESHDDDLIRAVEQGIEAARAIDRAAGSKRPAADGDAASEGGGAKRPALASSFAMQPAGVAQPPAAAAAGSSNPRFRARDDGWRIGFDDED